jgi:hypothetical protein
VSTGTLVAQLFENQKRNFFFLSKMAKRPRGNPQMEETPPRCREKKMRKTHFLNFMRKHYQSEPKKPEETASEPPLPFSFSFNNANSVFLD